MAELEKVRRIGPVDITVHTISAALTMILSEIASHRRAMFAFCNAHTVNLARGSPALSAALARATILNDGVGIDMASRLLYGSAFPANLNGTDFTPMLLSALSAKGGDRVFLLGSAPGVAASAATVIKRRYPGLDVVGVQHGFFSEDQSEALCEYIRHRAPDLVLVGMGQPRQEVWAADALDHIDTVFLCVGAFLDFVSGEVSRAPRVMRRARLEWIYRLLIEPRRMAQRYLIGNARFLADVLIDKMTGRPN